MQKPTTKGRLQSSAFRPAPSAPEAQTFDDGLIFFGGSRLEIVEEFAALIDHLEKAAAGSVIALVGTEVLAESVDALGQECDLHFRRPGVIGAAPIFRDDARLLALGQWHLQKTSEIRPAPLRGRAFYLRTGSLSTATF